MELRSNIYDYVKWGQKGTNEVHKKMVLAAVDFDAELVFQTTEPGQQKMRFADVCRVSIPNTAFYELSEALFKRAALEINRKSFKARELTQDSVLADLAYISKDFHIFRVKSMMLYRDGNHSRVTNILVHKVNGWDDIKAANKAAMDMKNGSLGFRNDTCVFSITLPSFPVIQGNWADAQDIMVLNAFAKKLDTMFEKPTSYGSFLDRVYNNKSEEGTPQPTNLKSEPETTGTTVVTGDDEFPF